MQMNNLRALVAIGGAGLLAGAAGGGAVPRPAIAAMATAAHPPAASVAGAGQVTWYGGISSPGGSTVGAHGSGALTAGVSPVIASVSCASAGNCAAGGSYNDGSGQSQAFVVSEVNGRWGRAIEVPGSGALNVGGNARLRSVSCASAGNCAAGGTYDAGERPAGNGQAFVVSEVHGRWGRAIEVPGSGALNAGVYAEVSSVSCASAGNCTAGGYYIDRAGHGQVFVVTERNGRWGKAIEVPGVGALNAGGDAQVSEVSCGSAGNCAAGGYYTTDPAGYEQGFVVSERNGRWGKAFEMPGSRVLNPNPGLDANVNSVSCASAGNCAAVGYYTDRALHSQPFAVTEKNGRWGRPFQVPGSHALDAGRLAAAIATSVSCASAGNCAAGGYYYTHGYRHVQVFAVSERNGRWGKAIEVPGVGALNAGGEAYVSEVSCASAGNCAAVGTYTDGFRHVQVFVVSERNGRWGKAIEVPGVGALNPGLNAGGVPSVSCASAGNCAAGGDYGARAFVTSEKNGRWAKAIEIAAPSATGHPRPANAARSGPAQSAYGWISHVSCGTTSMCMAIASYRQIGVNRTLIEIWRGGAWQIAPSPGIPLGPESVSCVGASFCAAVGGLDAAVWNGKTWRVFRKVPNQGPGSSLDVVSCATTSFCMAGGSMNNLGGGVGFTDEWNGSTWSDAGVNFGCPPIADCGLSDLSCPTAMFCMATGLNGDCQDCNLYTASARWTPQDGWQYPPGQDIVGSAVTCASASFCLSGGVEWNGSAWVPQTAPPPAGLPDCTTPTFCMAVGNQPNGSGRPVTLAQQWNGTSWVTLSALNPGTAADKFLDASCAGTSFCMAVGYYTMADRARLMLAEQWNGTSWQVVRSPTPFDPAEGFSAVSCPVAGICVEVGAYITRTDVRTALAERWTRHGPRVLAPVIPGGQDSELDAVACRSSTQCVAVGSYDNGDTTRSTLAETWNGISWQRQVTPATGNSQLAGLSCPAAKKCVAVGRYLSSAGANGPLAETWNGSTWRATTVPAPAGALAGQLSGVSCARANLCIAVGAYRDGPNDYLRPLADAWNGNSWRKLTTGYPGAGAVLWSVSCTSAIRCIAVGQDTAHLGGPERAFAESWNGRGWKVLAATAPGNASVLTGVSCTKAGCLATGGYIKSARSVAALSEWWNGTTWRQLRTPNRSPSYSDLFAVSCPAATACVAAGESGVQNTLAERWSGTTWSTLPTANPNRR